MTEEDKGNQEAGEASVVGDEEGRSSGIPQRQMFEGSWQCADCGKEITSLPFQPSEGSTVSCKECYLERRGRSFQSRSMVQGEWECSDCGKAISELPFQPADGRPIFCKDCYKKNRSVNRPTMRNF